MSVAVEDVEVDRPPSLRVWATIDRSLERALPPLRALPFVMKTSRQSEETRACGLDTKTLGNLSRAVFGPALVLIELLGTICFCPFVFRRGVARPTVDHQRCRWLTIHHARHEQMPSRPSGSWRRAPRRLVLFAA